MLTNEQRSTLLKPIKSSRVCEANRQKYLESYDVIAHLIRIFGFGGWDSETVHGPTLVFEQERGTSGKWDVCYKATVRISIKDMEGNYVCSHDGSSTGDAQNQNRTEAHDLALKAAESTAEKRAARKLGDQFGLSLYDKGSTAPVVKHLVSGERAGSDPPSDAEFSGLAEEAVKAEDAPATSSSPERSSATPEAMSVAQRGKIFAMTKQYSLGEARAVCTQILGHTVEHLGDLTKSEAHKVIEALNKHAATEAAADESDRLLT